MAAHEHRRPRVVRAGGRDRPHVVIAGGGVAAVETLLALRALAGLRIKVTLVSREQQLLYRPVTVAEAFDRGEARAYDLSQIVGNRDSDRIVWDSLMAVDPDDHLLTTDADEKIAYDTLVVATGAVTRDPLPGALTFAGAPMWPRCALCSRIWWTDQPVRSR